MKAHLRPGSDSLWAELARFYGGYLLAKGFEDLPLMRKTRVEQSLGFETSMSAIRLFSSTTLREGGSQEG